MTDITSHTTFALIDLDALAHNVRRIKAHVGPSVELYAVVKANAYGHGAIPIARTALENGASRLAVARINEGIALRQAGITAPILVMGYFLPSEAQAALEHDLTLTVTNQENAEAVAAAAQKTGKEATIHLKVDTGMGRFGILPAEAIPFAARLFALEGCSIEGIYSHFSVADLKDKSYTESQFALFSALCEELAGQGFSFPIRHIANSAATLDLPETHLEAVRTGIAMYGLLPSDEVRPPFPLEPVLSLHSHVARIRTLPAGSSISYGRTYITPHEMPVALVPVGYGDGFPRILSNTGQVLIKGKPAPIIGRVCMDQIMVNAEGIGGIEEGDEVVLIGAQGEGVIRAEDLARLAQTINYEITTGLLPRVTRVYRREGEIIETQAL